MWFTSLSSVIAEDSAKLYADSLDDKSPVKSVDMEKLVAAIDSVLKSYHPPTTSKYVFDIVLPNDTTTEISTTVECSCTLQEVCYVMCFLGQSPLWII